MAASTNKEVRPNFGVQMFMFISCEKLQQRTHFCEVGVRGRAPHVVQLVLAVWSTVPANLNGKKWFT